MGKIKGAVCKPSKYAVYDTGTKKLTFGFRCAVHQIESKRYITRELRGTRLEEHQRGEMTP